MRKKNSAFTLIEMIVVMTIIVILSGLVVAVVGYVNRKAAMTRASTEIATFLNACQNYKADAGRYPQDTQIVTGANNKATFTPGDTDKLKPKEHLVPTSSEYSNAGKYLYQQLTGDKSLDGIPDDGEPVYLKDFDPRMLKADRDVTGKIIKVYCFWDPFGYPYGYSTAAMLEEQKYQAGLKEGSAPTRPTGVALPGFNLTTFDLWSTAGNKPNPAPTSDIAKESEQAKWLKNW